MSTFVFVHVSKTGGISATAALQKLVDGETMCRCYAGALPDSYDGVGLVTSHHRFVDAENVPGEKYFLTTVRDPVERSISLFRFWNSIRPEEATVRGYAHVTALHSMNYDDFILAGPDNPAHFVDNEMTRQFSNADGPLTEAHYDEAVSNLEKCEAIFRTDHLDRDQKLFFDQIGCGHLFAPVKMNVTDENHKVYPDNYRVPAPVDLNAVSDAAKAALLEKTAYDRRLYQAALLIGERKRSRPPVGAQSYPILRGRIARGETIVPGNNDQFRSILGRGWGDPDKVVWSVESTASLIFKVKDDVRHAATAVLEIDICPLKNRKYLIVNVKADDRPAKSILFLQSGAMVPARFLSTYTFDFICTDPHWAKLEIELGTSSREDATHTIEITHDGAASPALLGHNHDERLLGVRFVSLGIV